MARKGTNKIKRAEKTEEQKTIDKAIAVGVPEHQARASGRYTIVDVKLKAGERVETNTTVRTRNSTLVERWFREGGPGFDEPQARAVAWVQGLWEAAGHVGPTMSAWGAVRGCGGSDGLKQHKALGELSKLKRQFTPLIWNAFEDACRNDMAAGDIGATLTTPKRSAHQAARSCVGFVASIIADQRRL